MQNHKFELLPGIIEKDWSEIEKKLKIIKGFSKNAHIDVIDGKFANNLTFTDPKPFKEFSSDIFLEVHLMVEKPEDYLKPFADAGFKRFLGQVEKMNNIPDFVAQGQILGEVGLALDGPTMIEVLDGFNLEDLDCLLIYTSERVGFAGPPMKEERLDKIKKLRERTSIPIEADGGIQENTIKKARAAGANRFVATSFIWESENPEETYKNLLGKISG